MVIKVGLASKSVDISNGIKKMVYTRVHPHKLTYLLFHNVNDKLCGMYYPVGGKVHIKIPVKCAVK